MRFIRCFAFVNPSVVGIMFISTSIFWIYSVQQRSGRSSDCSTTSGVPDAKIDSVTWEGSSPVEIDTSSHPFEAGHPKILVILAYQRSGSTLFGHLFNTNPDVFYIYEPLDALYSSLYGTKHGWNVPTDITTFQDGSDRIVPTWELDKVSEYLRSLLLCDVDSLPTETFAHRFNFFLSNESSALLSYSDCIRNKKLSRAFAKYNQTSPWVYCGERFGQMSIERQIECRLMLTNDDYRKEHVGHDNITLFEDYLESGKELRKLLAKNCLSLFSNPCNSRKLRTTKVVRASMQSMKSLFQLIPNFRVIHLLRDPRAVVLSRKNFKSSGGLFTEVDNNGSMVLEAHLYCKTVARDIKIRMELEQSYPGKILTIVYDDMVKNFKQYAEKVYGFMETPIPNSTSTFIDEIELNRKLSKKKADKWKDVITFQEHAEIWSGCDEFYRLSNYNWPR